MLPRRFIDFARIGGQFVIESIEINAFPPRHQPLLVRTAEVEMPEQRALFDLVPIADARQRRIDHHPFGDPRRILRGERIADHVADIVRHQIGVLDFQGIHYAGDIHRLVLLGVPGVRMRREAHAAKVRNDDRVGSRQHCRSRRPHVAGIAEAVQHNDRGTTATDAHMDRRAVGLDLLGPEARRKRLDGESRSRSQQRDQHNDGKAQHRSLSRKMTAYETEGSMEVERGIWREAQLKPKRLSWCPGEDSNLHASRR